MLETWAKCWTKSAGHAIHVEGMDRQRFGLSHFFRMIVVGEIICVCSNGNNIFGLRTRIGGTSFALGWRSSKMAIGSRNIFLLKDLQLVNGEWSRKEENN